MHLYHLCSLSIVAALAVALGCSNQPKSQAQKDFEQGVDWHKYGDPEKAIKFLDKSIDQDPENAEAFYYRGVSRIRMHNYDAAMDDLNRAVELNPEYARALAARADARNRIGQYDEALADCNAAIKLDDQTSETYSYRGDAWYHKGDFDKAIKDYFEYLRFDFAGNAEEERINKNLGYAQLGKGEYEEAIHHFTRAISGYDEIIRRNPKHETTNAKKAKVWMNIETYLAASQAYQGRATAHLSTGARDEAMQDLERAIKLAPDNSDALLERGLLHLRQRNYLRAREDFEKVIQFDPNRAEAYDRLAWIMATCPVRDYRDGTRAVDYASQARSLSGEGNWRVHETLAVAYAEAGDFAQAVEAQSKAVELAPAEQKQQRRALLRLFQRDTPYRIGDDT